MKHVILAAAAIAVFTLSYGVSDDSRPRHTAHTITASVIHPSPIAISGGSAHVSDAIYQVSTYFLYPCSGLCLKGMQTTPQSTCN